MTGKRKIYLFLAVAAMCWLAVAGWAFHSGRLGSSVDPKYGDVFNATDLFSDGVYSYQGDSDNIDKDTFGVILPSPKQNSAVTARALADLADLWSDKLILIVSFEEGLPETVATSWHDWQTPFGIIQIDGNSIVHLREEGALIDNEALTRAEDLNAFIPYFSRYFPGSRLVPLLFDRSAGTDQVVSYLNGLALRRDYYRVVMIMPDTDTELYSKNPGELAASFDQLPVRDLSGAVPPVFCTEVKAMKAILRFDGPNIENVIIDESVSAPGFNDIAVFFGGK